MAGPSKSKPLESDNFDTVQPSEITTEVYVPDTPDIEIIPGATGEAKGTGSLSLQAQELLFNEEIIDIMVSETTDENAEQIIYTACNGVVQYFQRGVAQSVKRKFVAILASCKEHNLTTPQFTARDGSRATSIKRTSSIKYPFMVLRDDNPRGAAWLKSLIQSQT